MTAAPDIPAPTLNAGRFLLTLRMHQNVGVHVGCVYQVIETSRAQSLFAELGIESAKAIELIEARGPAAVDRYIADHHHRLDFQLATLTPARPWDVSRDN